MKRTKVTINSICSVFFNQLDFVRVDWDGKEVVAYDARGQGFVDYEFLPNSKTRKAFEKLYGCIFDMRSTAPPFVKRK